MKHQDLLQTFGLNRTLGDVSGVPMVQSSPRGSLRVQDMTRVPSCEL